MRLVQEGAELGARGQPARGIRGDGLEQHRADREVRGRDDADARAFGLFTQRCPIRRPARRPDHGVQLQRRVAADVVADGIRGREIDRDVGLPSQHVGQAGARGILSLVEHADDLAIELRRQRLHESAHSTVSHDEQTCRRRVRGRVGGHGDENDCASLTGPDSSGGGACGMKWRRGFSPAPRAALQIRCSTPASVASVLRTSSNTAARPSSGTRLAPIRIGAKDIRSAIAPVR